MTIFFILSVSGYRFVLCRWCGVADSGTVRRHFLLSGCRRGRRGSRAAASAPGMLRGVGGPFAGASASMGRAGRALV